MFNYYSPENLPIFNELEGTYIVSLLKRKANCSPNVLKDAHEKAKMTMKVLTDNMIVGDVPIDHILQYY